MGFISVTEYSEKYGMDRGNVHKLIKAGRIPAVKIGRQYCIDENEPRPADLRVKSGAYKDWREKYPARDSKEE